MTRDEFCSLVKGMFPEISKKADKEYVRRWDDYTDDEYYSYSWFEALANAINTEMRNETQTTNYAELFELISNTLMSCESEIYKTIDVAFVENLFWQVPESKAKAYWESLPSNLKELYVGFHHRTPL